MENYNICKGTAYGQLNDTCKMVQCSTKKLKKTTVSWKQLPETVSVRQLIIFYIGSTLILMQKMPLENGIGRVK